MDLIATHINADFDCLGSMIAARRLYPGAAMVFPGGQERTLREFFLKSAQYAFDFQKLRDIDLDRVERLILVDVRQSGQLVPQDPNDEPASVLLERVRNGVGAQFIAPKTRPAEPKRAQSIAPLRKPRQRTAFVGAGFPRPGRGDRAPTIDDENRPTFASLDAVLTAILSRMQPGKEYSRTDLADPLGLTAGRWNAAIQELKRRGLVRQVGEKRGARYLRA